MRGNPNWRQDLAVGDVVNSPDDQCCIVMAIDGDTITLQPKDDEDADTFTADRSKLK